MSAQHTITDTDVAPGPPPGVPPVATRPEPRAVRRAPEGAARRSVLLLIDASGSMADDGKSAALDHAVIALVERLQRSEDRSWSAGAIVFGPDHGARMHSDLRPVELWLRWPRLPGAGSTPAGSAFELAARVAGELENDTPVLVLFTDGFATDAWRSALTRLELAAPRAHRFAVGIGADADSAMLNDFASPPRGSHVLRTDEVIDIPALTDGLAAWMPAREGTGAYVPFEMGTG